LFTSCYESGFVPRNEYEDALKEQKRLTAFFLILSTSSNNFIATRQINDYLYYGSYDDDNGSIYNILNLCANVYTSFYIPEGKLVNAWTKVPRRNIDCKYEKFKNLKCLIGNQLEIIEIFFPDAEFSTRKDQCENIINGILVW